MDWDAAIERNREALKRVLVALVAMAGLEDGHSAIAGRQPGSAHPADGNPDCPLPTADCRPFLPRHLHRAILRLLRPAEAAARRLVIVMARELPTRTAPFPPPSRALHSPPASRVADGRRALRPAHPRPHGHGGEAALEARRRAAPAFPLFDPPRRWRPRRPTPAGVPRISLPGYGAPFPLPPAPSPHDAIDAAGLDRRLAALSCALDDLPAQARRFARWRARAAGAAGVKDAHDRHTGKGRRRRVWPLRAGRPPGWRRRPDHEIHDILNAVHGLAFEALEHPDTS